MDILKTLQKINAGFGPSGRETEIREIITEIAKPYADEISSDSMGNLYVHRKGQGKKVMFSAHMDSIGVIATFIEDSGYIRVGRIGHTSPATIYSQTVRFANGVKGVCQVNEDTCLFKASLQDMFVDIGVSSKKEAEKYVQPGDMAVYDVAPFVTPGNMIVSSYLDDRICCIAQLMALEELAEKDDRTNDVWFVFSTQEEVGCRGAKVAGYNVNPDYFVVCDVTLSDDRPKAAHITSASAGKGAAIKVMDASVISTPEVVDILKSIAAKKKIKSQLDVLKAGGTDAGPVILERGGIPSSGVSIPLRYVHNTHEMAALSDVEDTAKLLAAFAANKF